MSVEAIGSFDWDDLEVRAAHAMAPGAELSPVFKPAPQGLSTESTLAPAARTAAPQSRPVLEKPRCQSGAPNIMYALINDVHKKSEEQAEVSVKLLGEQIKQDMADIEHLAAERQKALEEHAKDIKKRNTWGILGTVAQYVLSAATIALGIACVSTGVGAGPGALLIASGGLGLFNRVMNDTGAWKAVAAWFTKSEELQRKIAQGIDMGMFFLSLGLGIAGGVWAFKAGAFAAAGALDADAKLNHIAAGIATAAGGAEAAFKIGGAAVDNRIAKTDAKMKESDGQSNLDYEEVNENTRQAEKVIRSTEQIGSVLQHAIEGSRVDL